MTTTMTMKMRKTEMIFELAFLFGGVSPLDLLLVAAAFFHLHGNDCGF